MLDFKFISPAKKNIREAKKVILKSAFSLKNGSLD